ncbi:hypothetical protein BCR43DRAFT_489784 [Syncephalastrum racemosum]|uniref:Uncharacterized protein n=1 Tax=Syncephalastrum racemosum TaxID=13706 RepID=A0A1X2HG50_SYNRA|nr:hypothetical protein BCR43DRAFT_489784 [Syncephalastrum racemosum]
MKMTYSVKLRLRLMIWVYFMLRSVSLFHEHSLALLLAFSFYLAQSNDFIVIVSCGPTHLFWFRAAADADVGEK